jgi:hypothetical protein
MNQIEVLRRCLGGIYIAITGALDAESAAYANETLLAFADDEYTDPVTAEVYRGLVESIAESDAPSDARTAFTWLRLHA